jgi:hypothetical protein
MIPQLVTRPSDKNDESSTGLIDDNDRVKQAICMTLCLLVIDLALGKKFFIVDKSHICDEHINVSREANTELLIGLLIANM